MGLWIFPLREADKYVNQTKHLGNLLHAGDHACLQFPASPKSPHFTHPSLGGHRADVCPALTHQVWGGLVVRARLRTHVVETLLVCVRTRAICTNKFPLVGGRGNSDESNYWNNKRPVTSSCLICAFLGDPKLRHRKEVVK